FSYFILNMQNEAFSSIDLVAQCLIDEPRSKAFEAALKAAIQTGARVLDVGTGSGLMAMFAARACAGSVLAIEFDPYVASVAKKNIEANGLSDKIKLVEGDGRTYVFPKGTHFDVVVMEMLTTGMVDEFQVHAVNNLHKQKVVSPDTIFVPARQQTFIELTNKDFSLYGFEFKMVQHLWNNLSENQKYRLCSKRTLLSEVSFGEENNEQFERTLSIIPTATGVVNSVRLSGETALWGGIALRDTETFDAPVVVPIKEAIVTEGSEVTLTVRYRFGFGYRHFLAEIQ
ncbi:MAG: 50S ribosomal protein L11 methyltransferase, partial [Patescibacteria group bacterium]